jgi:hypothetical protein
VLDDSVGAVERRKYENLILGEVKAYRDFWRKEINEWREQSSQLVPALKKALFLDYRAGNMLWFEIFGEIEGRCEECQRELRDKFHYDAIAHRYIDSDAYPKTIDEAMEWTSYTEELLGYDYILGEVGRAYQRGNDAIARRYGYWQNADLSQKQLYDIRVQHQASYVGAVNKLAEIFEVDGDRDTMTQIAVLTTASRMMNSPSPVLRNDAAASLAGWALQWMPRDWRKWRKLRLGIQTMATRGSGAGKDWQDLQLQLFANMPIAYSMCGPLVTTKGLWGAAIKTISDQYDGSQPVIEYQKDGKTVPVDVTMDSLDQLVEAGVAIGEAAWDGPCDELKDMLTGALGTTPIRLGRGEKKETGKEGPESDAGAVLQSFLARRTPDDIKLWQLVDITMPNAKDGNRPLVLALQANGVKPKDGAALIGIKDPNYRKQLELGQKNIINHDWRSSGEYGWASAVRRIRKLLENRSQ